MLAAESQQMAAGPVSPHTLCGKFGGHYYSAQDKARFACFQYEEGVLFPAATGMESWGFAA